MRVMERAVEKLTEADGRIEQSVCRSLKVCVCVCEITFNLSRVTFMVGDEASRSLPQPRGRCWWGLTC